MDKKAQNIQDMLSIFMRDSVRPDLTNKEAQYLYDIWSKIGEKDSVVADANPMISSLINKGFLEYKGAFHAHKEVKLTKKAKETIRNIVLYAEKSAFEKNNNSIDYDSIYKAIKFGPVKQAGKKVASIVVDSSCNWLKKLSMMKTIKRDFVIAASGNHLDPGTRRAVNSELVAVGRNYYPTIPIDLISQILEKNNLVLLQEDGTPFRGILTGNEGHDKFDIGFKNSSEAEGVFSLIDNSWLIMSWSRSDTGKYNVTAYLS